MIRFLARSTRPLTVSPYWAAFWHTSTGRFVAHKYGPLYGTQVRTALWHTITGRFMAHKYGLLYGTQVRVALWHTSTGSFKQVMEVRIPQIPEVLHKLSNMCPHIGLFSEVIS
jgi:hypothetical protein